MLDHQFLELLQDGRVALPSESAQDDSEQFRRLGFLHFVFSNRHHLVHFVHLLRELLVVRIVLEEPEMRVANHGALDVESAISDEDDDVAWACVSGEVRRRATEHFSLGPGLALRQLHFGEAPLLLEHHFRQEQGRVELNNSHQEDRLVLVVLAKVLVDALDKEINVKLDLDEDVERVLDHQIGNGNQAAVSVVHDEVTFQLFAGNVVDAAGAVRHISQDKALDCTELAYYVRYQRTVQKQTLWKLQRDLHHPLALLSLRLQLLLLAGQNLVNSLRDFVVVVPRQNRARFHKLINFNLMIILEPLLQRLVQRVLFPKRLLLLYQCFQIIFIGDFFQGEFCACRVLLLYLIYFAIHYSVVYRYL